LGWPSAISGADAAANASETDFISIRPRINCPGQEEEGPMKRRSLVVAVLFGTGILGCEQMPSMPSWVPGSGWTTLIDGEKGLENFDRVGDANWRAEGGAIVADKGKGGYLVTKNSYKDFQIRAEFWADHNTNSGIWIRLTNPKQITGKNSYEVNIYDQRPQPKYGTGAIVDLATVAPMPKAGGKWNTYEITAKGSQLTVVLNGQQTVSVQDSKFPQGPFGLQFNNHGKAPGGAIKWRKVQVKPL
jgi:hypothetical protein